MILDSAEALAQMLLAIACTNERNATPLRLARSPKAQNYEYIKTLAC